MRFELTYQALAPELTVIAPWRDWDIHSREDALAYAERHGIPVPVAKGDLYSRDGNLWHLSHEGGLLEDPATPAPEAMFTPDRRRRPSARRSARRVAIDFEAGTPVGLDGRRIGPVELVEPLNAIAGAPRRRTRRRGREPRWSA